MPDPARLNVKKTNSPISYPRPQDHPFFREHPVSPANVIKAYQASTAQEKAQGMRWYADVHLLAGKMADGDAREGAILLAAYSPQANWPVDMLNAARAAEEHRALGPHDGLISGDMQANAQEALDGASVEEALQAPKTLAFAKLIEHGGDAPDDPYGQVVIDRHAASVAVGEQLPNHSPIPIGKARYHEYVADQYREATRQLNEAGIKIAPHQLQAITWLHQQAANQAANELQAADKTSTENARATGRRTALKNAWARWMSYAGAEGLPLHPGTTSLVSNWDAMVELAFRADELRDTRGRWTRFGGVNEAAKTAEKNREGFSVSVRTGQAPPSGYMVAQTDHTHVFPAEILDDHAKLTRAIDDMIMAEKSAFSGKQAYLGGWVHDGKLWLEPSDNFDNKYAAVAAGKARNQISIFDLQTYDEIQTGGHGGGRITEHANQGAGQGPGGIRGPARGRAAGGGLGSGHGDPVGIAFQLAWQFDPREMRDRTGKWTRTGAAAVTRFDPLLEFIPERQRVKAQAEIQKDLDIQARTVPGIAEHQQIILAPLVPDDTGDGTAQGETMPDGTIYLKADITAAIGGADNTMNMMKNQEYNGFWTPIDAKYTAADHSLAHEIGHVVGLHMGKKVLTDPEYWGAISKAIGILPPRTYRKPAGPPRISPDGKVTHPPPGKETVRADDLAEWAYRNSYALTEGVSLYGASNPFEMQADLWAEFTMSSHPRPAAMAFGKYALAHLPAADLHSEKAS
jgi:hypothetical protein